MNANSPHDAIDHAIDRALSTLRDAQPRSGLNSRILSSLEHRAALHATDPGDLPFHSFIVKGWSVVCGRSPLRACSPGWGSKRENKFRANYLALWAATSAAVIAIASLAILHYSTPNKNAVIVSEASHSDAQSKNPDVAHRAQNPESFSTTNLAQPTSAASSRPKHRSGAAARSGENTVLAGAPASISGSTTPTDAQALADLHAPSHPAPPLPLTPQEKLLLRGLRYGNLTQIAELNPIVRARQQADETVAFKTFFPDPPPLKQPLGDSE